MSCFGQDDEVGFTWLVLKKCDFICSCVKVMKVNKLLHTYCEECVFVYVGGQSGHLDVQPHWVTALAWPQSKGLIEGCLGLTTDSLLVGRVDGSVAVIEVFDSSTFCRRELQHCSRTGGKWSAGMWSRSRCGLETH